MFAVGELWGHPKPLTVRREYNIGLRCELERKTAPDDAKRGCELAAYFTHTKLHPTHLVLVLRSAMNASFKLKCYATSATFCRRMLELPLQPKVPPLPGTPLFPLVGLTW